MAVRLRTHQYDRRVDEMMRKQCHRCGNFLECFEDKHVPKLTSYTRSRGIDGYSLNNKYNLWNCQKCYTVVDSHGHIIRWNCHFVVPVEPNKIGYDI